jgi:hypothetical protein
VCVLQDVILISEHPFHNTTASHRCNGAGAYRADGYEYRLQLSKRLERVSQDCLLCRLRVLTKTELSERHVHVTVREHERIMKLVAENKAAMEMIYRLSARGPATVGTAIVWWNERHSRHPPPSPRVRARAACSSHLHMCYELLMCFARAGNGAGECGQDHRYCPSTGRLPCSRRCRLAHTTPHSRDQGPCCSIGGPLSVCGGASISIEGRCCATVTALSSRFGQGSASRCSYRWSDNGR